MAGGRDLAGLRRDYAAEGLTEGDLAATWLEQFSTWFDEAAALAEPNAAVLATATPDGVPSARTVLVKAFDEHGFVVYTNLRSRKAREALGTRRAALLFSWVPIERQVHVEGAVEEVSREKSEAYFRSRPRAARIAAWTSRQSEVVADRSVLEQRHAVLSERFGDEVPLPEFWGGLRVVPSSVEFWQGRPDRLHDRLRYVRGTDGGWTVQRLSP